MATRDSTGKGWAIYRRANGDGSLSHVAQVRVRPFRPISRTFTTKGEATHWGEEHAKALQPANRDAWRRQGN